MNFFSFWAVSQIIFLLEFDSDHPDFLILHETMYSSLNPQFFKIKTLVNRINVLLSMKSAQTLPLEEIIPVLAAIEKWMLTDIRYQTSVWQLPEGQLLRNGQWSTFTRISRELVKTQIPQPYPRPTEFETVLGLGLTDLTNKNTSTKYTNKSALVGAHESIV